MLETNNKEVDKMVKLTGIKTIGEDRTIGLVSDVQFSDDENPQTVEIDIDLLENALEIMKRFGEKTACLTVVGGVNPLILTKDIKGVSIVVSPIRQEHSDVNFWFKND